jgi:hypothetical protein
MIGFGAAEDCLRILRMKHQLEPISIPVDLWVTFEFAAIIKTSRQAPFERNRENLGEIIRLDKQCPDKRRLKFIMG